MQYELAKQLKEAGFPQKEHGTLLFEEGTNLAMTQKQMTARSAYDPTLEELIDACGDKFINLKRDGEGWVVNGNNFNFGDATGKSPTEAVAKLWLALNPNH